VRLAVLAGLWGAAVAAAAPGLPPPAWEVGQRWTVRVASEGRRLEEADDGSQRYLPQRGREVPWEFEVVRAKEVEGFPADEYLVLAQRTLPPVQTLRLEFVAQRGSDGPRALALVAVTTAGGQVLDFRKQDHRPGPVLMRGTALPVVFPFLEVGAPRNRRFPRVRHHGGIPFAEDVLQRMAPGKGAAAMARDLGALLEEDAPGWAIEIQHPLSKGHAHMVWVEGEPWPRALGLGVLRSYLVR
jgi:hypothetical protein